MQQTAKNMQTSDNQGFAVPKFAVQSPQTDRKPPQTLTANQAFETTEGINSNPIHCQI